MKYFTYILFSPSNDTFYVGSTRIPMDDRLERHLTGYYGKTKFTAKFDDWEVFHTISCTSYSQAVAIERHIKKMKSTKYIKNLKSYPEISEKLLIRFNS